MCYKVQSCQAFSNTPHPTGMHSGLSDGNEATELQRRLEEHSANTQYCVKKKMNKSKGKTTAHISHIFVEDISERVVGGSSASLLMESGERMWVV